MTTTDRPATTIEEVKAVIPSFEENPIGFVLVVGLLFMLVREV